MVDRILHISHKFAGEYNKDLLQRAAEVAVYKTPAATVSHLMEKEKMGPADAQALAQKIQSELLKVNRAVLLQYAVILTVFSVVVFFGVMSRSYVFAALFALPAVALLYSMLKFIRRNPFR